MVECVVFRLSESAFMDCLLSSMCVWHICQVVASKSHIRASSRSSNEHQKSLDELFHKTLIIVLYIWVWEFVNSMSNLYMSATHQASNISPNSTPPFQLIDHPYVQSEELLSKWNSIVSKSAKFVWQMIYDRALNFTHLCVSSEDVDICRLSA